MGIQNNGFYSDIFTHLSLCLLPPPLYSPLPLSLVFLFLEVDPLLFSLPTEGNTRSWSYTVYIHSHICTREYMCLASHHCSPCFPVSALSHFIPICTRHWRDIAGDKGRPMLCSPRTQVWRKGSPHEAIPSWGHSAMEWKEHRNMKIPIKDRWLFSEGKLPPNILIENEKSMANWIVRQVFHVQRNNKQSS